ncbi:BZ3500_MvSof-1268-A1-R1_Chr4-2g06948 [Microbotryum saponariae]|uniref:BZ3500_MvSof-1268-A1-R1_Chr4-2g06948 protein n=1 Tax=Microbotryum saponariae TaxID=289078 RepID=A0A2X0M3Q0_9BASI|nr:BZ3500_MvSof-1268-A1-R1_Chr4-2g06948 [Microbotryum saponariae]SDA06613.1 BZ3501_MvSof-1269-A2-R1_Chr4-2g06659 [Microbotryum saponariae]
MTQGEGLVTPGRARARARAWEGFNAFGATLWVGVEGGEKAGRSLTFRSASSSFPTGTPESLNVNVVEAEPWCKVVSSVPKYPSGQVGARQLVVIEVGALTSSTLPVMLRPNNSTSAPTSGRNLAGLRDQRGIFCSFVRNSHSVAASHMNSPSALTTAVLNDWPLLPWPTETDEPDGTVGLDWLVVAEEEAVAVAGVEAPEPAPEPPSTSESKSLPWASIKSAGKRWKMGRSLLAKAFLAIVLNASDFLVAAESSVEVKT